jgi:hypothetical protein
MQSQAILTELTELRLGIARFLVIFSFVWPFINANYLFPQAEFEVNFLPVLLAVVLAPEIFAADGIAMVLLGGTLAVAAFWGSTNAVLRLAIGAVPCLFLINFQQYCLSHKQELIPQSIAYRTLQVFVGFSVLQWVDFYVHPVIPGLVTNILTTVVPRYSGQPYDELGLRGVQGWASEPSGAAVVCFSFAVVAVQQDPKKRWRVLLILAILLLVNKSVYGLVLLLILGLVYLLFIRHKSYSILGLATLAAGILLYASRSVRLTEVIETALLYGADPSLNIDLARVNQIVFPLVAFPKLYMPFNVFGVEMQPLGLLPLLVGYGSVLGLALYLRLAFFKLPLQNARSLPLAFVALVLLSLVVPSDLIPAIIAFGYAVAPTTGVAPNMTWYQRLTRKAEEAYAAP